MSDDGINIVVVGGVSTGKSTVLNSFFAQKLAQCHFRRTTMVPTVYKENTISPTDPNEVYAQIAKKNAEIIQKTENLLTVSEADYSEHIFNVGKLDMQIADDGTRVNIYDIPGLNDSRTKTVYYNYLDQNFHKFNIVLFLVDIRSGLNTSDEFDILNFITTQTKHHIENNGRQIFTLVVVNKADDMQLKESTNEVVMTGELKEMFDHVNRTVRDEFSRKNIGCQLIDVIPLCAADAYLYRMVQKYDRQFKLTPEQILKIGVNEMGKKFSVLKPHDQEMKVYDMLRDEKYIDMMLKLSGFHQFKLLRRFLKEGSMCKKMLSDNILYNLRSIPAITYESYGNLENAICQVETYMELYHKVRAVDEAIFQRHLQEFAEQNITLFEKQLRTFLSIDLLMKYYDTFVSRVAKPYFAEFYNVNEYSSFVKTRVKNLSKIVFEKSVTVKDLLGVFKTMQEVDSFVLEDILDLFDTLLSNPRKQTTIDQFLDEDVGDLIELLDACAREGYNTIRLLRFLIINRLNLVQQSCDNSLYKRFLIYRNFNEIAISDYIDRIMPSPPIDMVVNGLDEIELENPAFKFDLYYLSQDAKKKIIYN